MKFFYKWINKWENNYIEKKLKELDEHPIWETFCLLMKVLAGQVFCPCQAM